MWVNLGKRIGLILELSKYLSKCEYLYKNFGYGILCTRFFNTSAYIGKGLICFIFEASVDSNELLKDL